MARSRIPKFKSEAEESAWWDKHRDELDREFLDAAKKGHAQRLTRERLAARTGVSTKVVSIRISEEDISLAREQAAKKGLPYQTYMKSLLHEALREAD